MANLLLMIIYVIFTVSGLILFKLGVNSSQFSIISKGIINLQVNYISLIGIVCYATSFVFYLILIAKNNLSFFVPVMTGIVYVSVLIASTLFLKERMTIISISGSALILIGVLLVISQGK